GIDTLTAASIRCGMASWRGQTIRRQLAKPRGKWPQMSRHRKCWRIPRSMGPELIGVIAMHAEACRASARWGLRLARAGRCALRAERFDMNLLRWGGPERAAATGRGANRMSWAAPLTTSLGRSRESLVIPPANEQFLWLRPNLIPVPST